MAEKRMFAKTIVDSDAFMEMPVSSQLLYFHLSMRADDDGFINNPKRIARNVGANDDDLKMLMYKNFIIAFENGVIVIKHWWIHNTLRKDRYKETVYQEERSQLDVKDNGSYTLNGNWQPNGNQMATVATQIKLNEIKVNEIKEEVVTRKRFTPPTLDEVIEYCSERGNKVDAQKFIDYYTSNGWMVGKNKMKDWKAAVRSTWEKDKFAKPKTDREDVLPSFYPKEEKKNVKYRKV